jgi:hypothetical protein
MSMFRQLPWFAVVLSTAGSAIAAAAREGRSISIAGDGRLSGTSGGLVPEFHTVERGDTLWDITGYYFGNPWAWPRVWGLNPQITNPHWIFPRDHVRLLNPQAVAARPRADQPLALPVRPPAGTVFFRNEGWLDRAEGDLAGTIVGSPEDQMLLSEGDQAYVEFARRAPRVGEQMTIYQDGQDTLRGDRSLGRVVRVIGSAVVESWDRNRNVATVRITESHDSIERGERVGWIPRRLEVVPPERNAADVRGSIVATIQPRELIGQNMVVFINRGTNDGVRPGNRFFILRRGDAWRQSLTISEQQATAGGSMDRDGDGHVDAPPGRGRADRNLPDEVVGEVLVVQVRPQSSTAVMTSTAVEAEVGDAVQMRRGY